MRTPTELVDEPDKEPGADEDWTVEIHGTASKFPGLAKFGIALGAGVAAVGLLLFAVPPVLPEALTRGTAESVLSDMLEMPVKITGEHSFRLLPNVSLHAKGIVAGALDNRGTALEIGSLDVDMSAVGLMSASADINSLAVNQPKLTVSMVQLTAADSGQEIDRAWGWWRNLTIGALNVSDGRVIVYGRDGRLAYDIGKLSLVSATPRAGEAEDGLAFDGSAEINGGTTKFRVSTSDPALFVLGNRWPVRFEATSDLLRAKFVGALAMRQQLIGEGNVELSSDDAARLNAWIGPILPARSGSKMSIKAEVDIDGDMISVSNATLKIGQTDARMAFKLAGVASGRTRLSGTLDADVLDLSSEDGAGLLVDGERTLGTAMLPPGEVALNWDRIIWRTHEFGQGHGTLVRGAGGSRVTIKLDEMDTYGGTLRGEMTLDVSEGMRALDAEATLVNVELGPLAASSSVSLATPVTGQSTISVKLFSVGATADQLMEALVGDAEVIISDGVLTLPSLTQGVMETQRKGIPFKTLTGHFHIAQGIGRSEDLLLRADDVSLVGKGTVDLTDGRIDLDVGRLGGKEGERSLKRFRVSGPASAITVEAINGS